ncbi:MAG: AtpZ/AtpI family protein [Lachnospiraceae bacterium]|nr:AtpZ/AtpI family protein [Lachnospiraceae bacterium]
MKHDKPYDRSVFKALTMITQFGINMLVPIGMMTALGIWLDRRFETGWITVVLFFVGAIAGGQNVWRMAKRIFADHEAAEGTSGETKTDK